MSTQFIDYTKPQNSGTNSECWNYYKIKNKILIMKLTNLYNYDGIKSFTVKPQIKLDYASVISNAGYVGDDWEDLLQSGIYDSAKKKTEPI